MAKLKVASVCDPLASAAKLSAGEKKQLTRYLKEEGLGSLASARKNDELAMQLVRIADGDEPAFELYLSSSGDGALFEHGSTTIVGNVIQHHFELVEEREGLVEKLTAVLAKKEMRRHGISTSVVFGRTGAPAKAPPAAGGIEAALALTDRSARRRAVGAIAEKLFGTKLAPYPKRRLDAAQRAFIAAIVDADEEVDLSYGGAFSRLEHNARAIGKAPAGPSDIEIVVGKERLPLWCAVSDVASGHLKPEPVLAAFRKLDAAKALAAWREIGSGEAYDLFEAHPLKDSESGIPRTPNNVKHRTRLFSWMADANVALGEPGRRAAEALTKTKITLDYRSGYPWAFIAILSLVRHAKAAGTVLASSHDELVARLDGKHGDAFAEPIVKEIEKSLPAPRLAAIAAIRKRREASVG